MLLSFVIYGAPIPQPRHQVTRGGIHYIPTDHPIRAYKAAIAAEASRLSSQPTDQPVAVFLTFVFERPPSHFNKSGLKPTARLYPARNDWDNLAKGVCDGLTAARVWIDDDQVVMANVVRRYAAQGEKARTEIAVSTLDDETETKPEASAC
jgi:Holliday junction resolvase RusA-like endonuclease